MTSREAVAGRSEFGGAPLHIRCPCGAVHPRDEFAPIGRQYGLRGEYVELANCPTCYSTISVARNLALLTR
jgi:hypothetical protein